MQVVKAIEEEVRAGSSSASIARRLYCVDYPEVMKTRQSRLFKILDYFSRNLQIPIMNFKIAGSAQTGYSFHSGRPFIDGESDLDIAIISSTYFERLLTKVQECALPYPDTLERPRQSVFPVLGSGNSFQTFMENVTFRGFIFPKIMPPCAEKQTIMRICRHLTEQNRDIFEEVNIGVYLSQEFFEKKQRPNIQMYRNKTGRK